MPVCSMICLPTTVLVSWNAGRQCMNFTAGFPDAAVSRIFNQRRPSTRPAAVLRAVGTADVAAAFASWRADCERARELVAAAPSLDVTGERRGERFSLRWILVHMIEEYARHNGHADLLRERIDGSVGE